METRHSIPALLAVMISVGSLEAQIVRVDSAATGPTHDGSSWCDAYLTLQDALVGAVSGTTIRVANGIYRPDEDAQNPNGTGNRWATFELFNGVTIEGGYSGCDASVPDNRNVVANETVISGDLDGNDGPDFANNSDNSIHVVTAGNVNATAILDGVTIKAGNANAAANPNASLGGGLLVLNGNPRIVRCAFVENVGEFGGAVAVNSGAAPTFEDCTFTLNDAVDGGAARISGTGAAAVFHRCQFDQNTARLGGAIMIFSGATPTLEDCTFTQNSAVVDGGAIDIQGADTMPILHRCQFDLNSAGLGGAMIILLDAAATLVDCHFSDNTAAQGGAINIQKTAAISVLRRCQFDRNSAEQAGAVSIAFGSPATVESCDFNLNSTSGPGGAMVIAGGSTPILEDCTFTGNVSADDGGAISFHASHPNITRCAFTGNHADEGGAVRNLDAAPTFVDCDFAGNSANGRGGAVFNVRAPADPRFENCRFWSNVAADGGAVQNTVDAHPTFANCLFHGNVASVVGAVIASAESGTTSFVNCTFSRNRTGTGGRASAIWSSFGSVTTLDNCIAWGNTGTGGTTASQQIDQDSSSTTVVTNSIVEQGCTVSLGLDAYNADPMFVDPDGADNTPGTNDDDFRLSLCSPAIDRGNNAPAGGLASTDLDGNPRVVNGTVDLGAYEHQDPCVAPDSDGDGICDACSSCGSSSCAATPEVVVIKNRFLSFSAGDAGQVQAVRVTFDSLPAPFDLWNGAELWVGPTSQVSEVGAEVVPSTEETPRFSAATLRCTPFFTDWSDEGTIHVFHEGIVPGGTYRVDVIDETCDAGVATNFSAALPMTTAIWGDTVLDLSVDPPPPPEGAVNIDDALAVLERFSSAAGAIIKARADLEPVCLDLTINVTDVLASLAGFVGLDYPFTPTAGDPCNSTCPNVLP